MAVEIYRNSITDDQVAQLIKDLNAQPPDRTFRKGNKVIRTPGGNPVKAYKYYTNDDTDNSTVRIPLTYAKNTFNKNNNKYKYGKMRCEQKLPLRDNQIPIVNKAIKHLEKHNCTLIQSRPGSGKTVMASIISLSLGYTTVIIVNNMQLIPQWEDTYRNFTDCRVWVVGKGIYPANGTDVIICHVDRYDKVPKKLAATVGFMVIDECPMLCNQKGMDAILHFMPKYILGLSATPSRSRDGMFILMQRIIGEKIVKNMEVVKLDVIKIETPFKAKRNGKNMWTDLVQSIMYNDERNKLLATVANFYVEKGYKVMMITRENEHVVAICDALKEINKATYDTLYGKKSTYHNCNILVANAKKASVGFDEKGGACIGFDGVRISCVIVCASIGNWENVIQSAGRAFRSTEIKPCVVHVVDDDPTLEKHYGIAKEAYEKDDYEATFCIVNKRNGCSSEEEKGNGKRNSYDNSSKKVNNSNKKEEREDRGDVIGNNSRTKFKRDYVPPDNNGGRYRRQSRENG